MIKSSAEITSLADEMLSKVAGLEDSQKKALVAQWKQAARGHRKNASYYEGQGQFTRKRQELDLAECYGTTADAIERSLQQALENE